MYDVSLAEALSTRGHLMFSSESQVSVWNYGSHNTLQKSFPPSLASVNTVEIVFPCCLQRPKKKKGKKKKEGSSSKLSAKL